MTAELLAPCGMNCAVCYRHLGKKPCGGCLCGEENKPTSCRNCTIRQCAEERGYTFCYQCEAFPCKRLRTLDRSYRTRYGVSLVENGRAITVKGVDKFLQEQEIQYTCTGCGGVISLHDSVCMGCGKEYPLRQY